MGRQAKELPVMSRRAVMAKAGVEVAPVAPVEMIAMTVDRSDPEVSADYVMNIAGHNGLVGLSWQKGKDARSVSDVVWEGEGDKRRAFAVIDMPEGETVKQTKLPVGRLGDYFARGIEEGVISKLRVPNNQAKIEAGTLQAWDRDPATWKMVPRV